ncbi:MAG: T9SS type A sorting domain-containing protein [Bacteroidota bacterium]
MKKFILFLTIIFISSFCDLFSQSIDSTIHLMQGKWNWHKSIDGWGSAYTPASSGYTIQLFLLQDSSQFDTDSIKYTTCRNDTLICQKETIIDSSGAYPPTIYGNVICFGSFGSWTEYKITSISDSTLVLWDCCIDGYQHLFIKQSLLSINSVEKTDQITLFPNPATTSITISIQPLQSDAEVLIFNSLGEQVLNTKVHKAESEVQLDVAKLPAGMYFVKMNKYSGKFVKQN